MTLLQDISAVAVAVNVPGPAAAARLRDLGARVAFVEPPSGNLLAHAAPGWYAALTRDASVHTLDLKSPEDRARLDALLATADVLITASRPASLERLGLGWERLHAEHPRLCHVAITGYPPPRENAPGHDLTYLAHLGVLTPPEMPRMLVADMAGAERAATEALALLHARNRSGAGGQRFVALSEAAEAFAASYRHGITRPGNHLGGGLPNYRIYPAQTGYVAMGALEPQFFERFLAAAGMDDGSEAALAARFLEQTAEAWEAWAEAHDLPIAAIV